MLHGLRLIGYKFADQSEVSELMSNMVLPNLLLNAPPHRCKAKISR